LATTILLLIELNAIELYSYCIVLVVDMRINRVMTVT